MISFLKNWALSIVTLVLFLLMIEIMMPSGNTKKFVNLVAGFILLLAIIRPIAEVFISDFSISETFYADSNFLDRAEITGRSRILEEEQRTQVLKLYREKLINRIEQAVLEVGGIKKAKVDLIINEDYESGNFGEVKRVYVELTNGANEADKNDKAGIKIERITVGERRQTADDDISPGVIDQIKKKVGRITNVDEDDVVITLAGSQGGY
jgi:stage III sporulation protein AF